MAATLPVYSVWTRKTTRLCPLSSRRPLVTSSCQLVVTSPLVVLSLCHPLVILSRELVVTLPLAVFSLHHPLVLSLRQLVVASLLLVLLLRHPHVLSSRRLVLVSPLDPPPTRRLVVLSSRHLVISSSRHAALYCIITSAGCRIISHHSLIVPPSCPLIMPAGCCVASPCTPLSSSCRTGHPSTCHCLAIVYHQLHQTPSNAATVIECHHRRRL